MALANYVASAVLMPCDAFLRAAREVRYDIELSRSATGSPPCAAPGPRAFPSTVSLPDGTTYFCVARTLGKDGGGYHAQHAVQAVEIGCPIGHARELVYSDGVDVESLTAAVPVGVTCRLCERQDTPVSD